jgi:arylsulfatase A-like enzyme
MGRAGRILSSLFGLGAPGGPLGRSVRACLLFAVLAFSIESAWSLASPAVPTLARVRGLLAGLGSSCVLAATAGIAVFGLVWLTSLASPVDGGAQALAVRARRWLWEREGQADRVAGLLGAVPLLAVFCSAAFTITRALVIGMARPHFAAIAIVAAHLALLLGCAALYPAARNAGQLAARLLGRVPFASALVARAGTVLGALLVLAVCAAIAVLVGFWETFSYLPWRAISTWGGAALGTLAALLLAARLPAKLLWPGRAVRTALIACGLLALFTLDARGEESKRAVHETVNGRLGQRAALLLLDFDRDGALSVLGGGDCAAFDRRIGPLAIDVPNNRRDEDCDGADLDEKRAGVELRRNWPVPGSFPRKPPIVLITVDAFAASRMRALGHAREVTPTLDAFAARSVLFRYGFSQGPSTRLSFPSIFTSRFDTQIEQKLVGNHPYPIADAELMLAELLADEGYDPVAVISDAYFRRSRWASLTAGFKQVLDEPLRLFPRHNSAAVTDAALGALRKARKRPLFLWAHYFDAHPPHAAPDAIRAFGKKKPDVYDAELKLVDREIGRLLAGVAAKYGEQALIFVTGDHGIAFDAPRHARYSYGYDLSTAVLHVPLIAHGPGIDPAVMDGVVSTMDIAPTIANLLKVRRKLPFEGASLVPELMEGRRSRPERLLHQFYLEERLWQEAEPLEQIALRTDRYNLVHNRKTGTFELYDWRKDYFEQVDLADSSAHRASLVALKQQLALLTYRVYGRERSRAASVSLGRPR